MRRCLTIALFGFLALALGCTPKNQGEPKLLSLLGVDDKTTEASEEGVEKNYDALTLLRRGERAYDKEDYPEAVGEYQRFLELHPFHRLASYAQFRLGMSYYHQIDTTDRDEEPSEKALSAFEKLQKDFPQNLFNDQVQEKIVWLKGWLAQRQFYIGYFYYKKGAYPAAIHRFQAIIDDKEKTPVRGEALYYAALSQLAQGEKDEGARLLRELLDSDPKSPHRKEASKLLKGMEASPTLSRGS
jgi:outer membrane protein assembly factor BamD